MMKAAKAATILLILSIAVFSVPEGSARAEEYLFRDHEWKYGGYIWTWQLTIPHSYYSAYKGVSMRDRTKDGVKGFNSLVTTKDPYVQRMAETLRGACRGKRWGVLDGVNSLLAFVQCLPYTVDEVTSSYDEHPRSPLETLVDGG